MDYWGMWKRMEARARRAEVVERSKRGVNVAKVLEANKGKVKARKGVRQRGVCGCEGCTMENCVKCKNCQDMPRYTFISCY